MPIDTTVRPLAPCLHCGSRTRTHQPDCPDPLARVLEPVNPPQGSSANFSEAAYESRINAYAQLRVGSPQYRFTQWMLGPVPMRMTIPGEMRRVPDGTPPNLIMHEEARILRAMQGHDK